MLEALRGRFSKWLSCACRRQQLPFGRRPVPWLRRGPPHDVGLDHEVVSTTNHHKMLDIVSADEDNASFSADREGFDYCYPRWCVATAQPFEHVHLPQRSRSGKQYAMSRKRADLDSVPRVGCRRPCLDCRGGAPRQPRRPDVGDRDEGALGRPPRLDHPLVLFSANELKP
jgi:hypothetical protein